MMALGDVLGAARILVVDDEPGNVRMFDRLLSSAGCQHVRGVTDPRDTIARLAEVRPDLIILDLHMPHMDGFEVMQAIRPLLAAERYLPVLIVTADDAPTVKQRALAMGARDFLAKPFDSVEALLRIRNLLVTRQLYAQLEREQQQLEQAVFDRTEALHSTHLEIVERLARAAEYRDDNTGEHTRRVGGLAGLLARTLGLSEVDAKTIERAAALHDVGKVGVPDAILLKPGGLVPAEFDIIKTHAVMGARILSGSRVPLLRMAEEIAFTHHERWDGRGYPNGRIGEGIPAGRPGRRARRRFRRDDARSSRTSAASCPSRRWKSSGAIAARHFDPQVVDAFGDVFPGYLLTITVPADGHAKAHG